MVDMKRSKTKTEEMYPSMSDESPYPYGLELNLDSESLKKLGLEELPAVGSKFTVSGMAYVRSASSSEYEGEGRMQSLSLQITDLEVSEQADD